MKHNYEFFYIITLNMLTQPWWNIMQQQWRKMKSSLFATSNKNMGLWLMMRLNNWFGEIVPQKGTRTTNEKPQKLFQLSGRILKRRRAKRKRPWLMLRFPDKNRGGDLPHSSNVKHANPSSEKKISWMLRSFSLPEPSIVVPSTLDEKKKRLFWEGPEPNTIKRPSPIEPLSTTAADQTHTKPHSPSEGPGLKCFTPRYGPAETFVTTEHFSIQRSVGESTFFSQAAELNTKRRLFSVKQLAVSDLGDSHQTSSCSWLIWLGDRAA